MNNMVKRALSGIVYVALIVGCVLGGTSWIYYLSGLFAIVAGIELTNLLIGLDKRRIWALCLDIAALLFISHGPSLPTALLWLAALIFRAVLSLYIKEENPVKSLSVSFLIQIYIGVPMFLMSTVAYMASVSSAWSCHLILALFIFLWLNDTGAYLVGSLCGKHKLFQRISPNKTWEGFFGGWILNIIAANIFAFTCSAFFGIPQSWLVWTAFATIVTIFGTWGDLIESLIKRTLGAKDSGHLIPGHGGILDRIDSFLLAMPAAFIFFALILGNFPF